MTASREQFFFFFLYLQDIYQKDLCAIYYLLSIAHTLGMTTFEPTEVYDEPVVSCGQ